MSYKIESPLPVIEGGTGVQSNTPYAVLCGGTIGTAPIQSIASVGTSGYVLTSNGAGALPTFQNIGVDALVFAADTITTANPFAGLINIVSGNASLNAGSSVKFVASGSTVQLDVTDALSNTIIGEGAGNLTLTGDNNTIVGKTSAENITSGTDNAFLGFDAGASLLTGSFNVLLGSEAGSSYTTSESSNIAINASGTVAESHCLRLGSATGTGLGELNKAFIQGIRGITTGVADGIPVFIDSTGQLGTAGGTLSAITSITGDTGGAQTGPGITLAGGTTGLSFDGTANTITTTFAGITANGGSVLLATDAIATTVSIATGAGVKGVNIGSTNTTSSTNIRAGSNGVNIGSNTSNGPVTINTGTGTIGIATDSSNNAINIGTGVGNKVITIGVNSIGSTTSIVINSSSTITTTSRNGAITTNSGTGIVSISNDSTNNTINVGTGAGVKTVVVGSTNSTSTSTLQSGTAGIAITATNGVITANSGTGIISISNDASATTLNIGTGGAVKTISIGGTSANVIAIGNTQTGGSVAIGTAMTTGTVSIGGTGLQTGTVSIAPGTGAQAVNIATGGTGIKTVNIATGAVANVVAIGSVTGAASLTLNSGTAGITATGVVGTTAAGGVPVVISAAGLLGTVVSSRRFKHDIQDMNDESSNILDLRPVTFAYNSDASETKQYGLIAEEVDEIFPGIVVRNLDGEIETVQYHILPVLLLNEIKKLNARIAALENKL